MKKWYVGRLFCFFVVRGRKTFFDENEIDFSCGVIFTDKIYLTTRAFVWKFVTF